MDPHPFRFAYIGLGLRDEASIHREGDDWHADYPDAAGRPYLHAKLGPDGAALTEFAKDGRTVAETRDREIAPAIGRHAGGAINGEFSRFWWRVAAGARLVWIPLQISVRFTYIPAMGLARLRVPRPLGMPLPPVEPGPLATRLGLDYVEDEDSPAVAMLFRRYRDDDDGVATPIAVHRITTQGILVQELTASIARLVAPLAGVEWRPFLDPELRSRVAQSWPCPPPLAGRMDGGPSSYAIVEREDEMVAQR